MKLNSKQIIELLGLFAVVSSLLFVGMQLRLDRQIALADQYAFRAESFKNDYRAQLESDSNMSSMIAAWERGVRPVWWNEGLEEYVESNGITGLEVLTQILNANMMFVHLDNLYYQYLAGFLDEELWATTENNALRNSLRNPYSIQSNVFRFQSRDGLIERPINPVIRRLISEIENEH